MMLTLNTAKQLGVKNRLDAEQSILGGADYLRLVKEKIPDRIEEPDRTWFALAAYNVGFGHLEDARRLAEGDGANPDKWLDVKEYLPLLRQKKWYSRTRYGYARGDEPVKYVNNIRMYYQVLKQVAEPKAGGSELVDPETESMQEGEEIGDNGQDEENILGTDEALAETESDKSQDDTENKRLIFTSAFQL